MTVISHLQQCARQPAREFHCIRSAYWDYWLAAGFAAAGFAAGSAVADSEAELAAVGSAMARVAAVSAAVLVEAGV
jgi:hypothetical protein